MKKQTKKTINLLNSINTFIIESNLIKPNQKILIAISGGQDSISIFFICFIIKKQWNLQIINIYCNHLWKKETFYTFLHLSKISFIFRVDLSYTISLTIANSEQKSRNWRFNVYLRLLKFFKCNLITTGHTKSDQIETFLFNLTRGTGLKGAYSLNNKRNFLLLKKNDFNVSNVDLLIFKELKKKIIIQIFIYKSKKKLKKNILLIDKQKLNIHNKKINSIEKKEFYFNKLTFQKTRIIRPLLQQSRFDIKTICKKLKLPILPDKSNQENFYTRNRIRKQLLPTLRFFFNSQIDLSVWKYNQILIEEQKFVEKILEQIFQQIITENQYFFCINIPLFNSFPLAIQRKICFMFFENKLKIKVNFYTINLFIFTLKEKLIELFTIKTKIKKKISCICIFFPKIGILFFYKTIIIIVK